MSNQNSFYVYVLVDPVDSHIKYVGSSKKPEARFREHIASSNKPEHYWAVTRKSPKEAWISDLLTKKLKPRLWVIEECSGYENGVISEGFYIARLASEGEPLTNCLLNVPLFRIAFESLGLRHYDVERFISYGGVEGYNREQQRLAATKAQQEIEARILLNDTLVNRERLENLLPFGYLQLTDGVQQKVITYLHRRYGYSFPEYYSEEDVKKVAGMITRKDLEGKYDL
jgi:hypothetical protein